MSSFIHWPFPSRMADLKRIKTGRKTSFCVKAPGDETDCWIRGLDITPDGRIIIVDCYNKNMKVFNADKQHIASLKLPSPYGPIAIAAVDDDEAIVSLCQERQLFVISISTRELAVSSKIQLDFYVRALCCNGDKIVVCSGGVPASLKLIDKRGRIYWSRSPFHRGETLFSSIANVTCFLENDKPVIMVTDSLENSLVKFDGKTGDVIKFCGVYEKSHEGTCVDSRGIIYVCYGACDEIIAWNPDLEHHRIVLTRRNGLGNTPSSINYNPTNGQLMIAYSSYSDHCDMVDCYTVRH